MIVAHRRQFESICRQRGSDIANAMSCVVAQDGDAWTIDETNEAYPRATRSGLAAQPATFVSQPAPPAPTHGPGTELSKLLKRFGIEPTPTCKCRAKAAQMDAWGCDESSKPERIEEVVAVLREEATKRGLPFLDAAGRVLVRRAISNARREQARAEKAATAEGSEAT